MTAWLQSLVDQLHDDNDEFINSINQKFAPQENRTSSAWVEPLMDKYILQALEMHSQGLDVEREAAATAAAAKRLRLQSIQAFTAGVVLREKARQQQAQGIAAAIKASESDSESERCQILDHLAAALQHACESNRLHDISHAAAEESKRLEKEAAERDLESQEAAVRAIAAEDYCQALQVVAIHNLNLLREESGMRLPDDPDQAPSVETHKLTSILSPWSLMPRSDVADKELKKAMIDLEHVAQAAQVERLLSNAKLTEMAAETAERAALELKDKAEECLRRLSVHQRVADQLRAQGRQAEASSLIFVASRLQALHKEVMLQVAKARDEEQRHRDTTRELRKVC
jgi:hypothetical protein